MTRSLTSYGTLVPEGPYVVIDSGLVGGLLPPSRALPQKGKGNGYKGNE